MKPVGPMVRRPARAERLSVAIRLKPVARAAAGESGASLVELVVAELPVDGSYRSFRDVPAGDSVVRVQRR